MPASQQVEFFVSHDGKTVGPWSVQDIARKLQKSELAPTDYLYLDENSDWVSLLEYEPVASLLNAPSPAGASSMKSETAKSKPEWESAAVNPPVDVTNNEGDEWFVLKWDNRYGPFSYMEIVRMLQEKSIFEFDYVWKTGMSTWNRVAELTIFSQDRIREAMKQPKSDSHEVFFRRRHLRTKFNGSIVVHDNKVVWKGQSIEISEGGAGIVMNNAMVLPGQTLYVHFKAGDSVPPFNAVVEVVSKKFVKGVREKSAPIAYGVKFVRINKGVQKAIQEFVTSNHVA